MSLPVLNAELTLGASELVFLLRTGDLIKKPSFIEIVAASTENRGLSPVILTNRKNVESVAGSIPGKFQLKETTVVLDEAFGLQIAFKYCIKIVLYDETRSKLAESLTVITTLADVPAPPVITAARSKEVGEVELTLRLAKWSGADAISARVCLFRDSTRDELDDINILDIAISPPTEHVTGTTYVLDLAPHVVLGANTDYIVKIAFESEIGLGPYSEAFSFKAVDVPDSPLQVEMQHSHLDNVLAVTWKAGADSVQYGDLLRFRVDLLVMPFMNSFEEIVFASIAQKVPELTDVYQDFNEENSEVSQISLEKLNEHIFVLDEARQAEFLSQMSLRFPENKVSRKLKFRAKVFASNGINSSLAAESQQITVIRFTLPDNYTELFELTVKGQQTKNSTLIERQINFEAKLKAGITFAQLKTSLTDLPSGLGLSFFETPVLRETFSTRRLGTPRPPPTPWAKAIVFQLDLKQGPSKQSVVNRIIVEDATPTVSTTPISTEIPFSTSDELVITFWLIDADDNKSYSTIYPLSIPLEVPALVYRSDTSFTVNAGIISILVKALSGTKTETFSAKLLLRNFSDVSPNPTPFIETLPLLLNPTGKHVDEFKISYDAQLPANASQVSEIKLSVFEKQAGVITPLQIYSEQTGSRVVLSNTNLTDIADSVQLKFFDRTVSPSSPSEYVALLYIEKSVLLRKLKVYNNVEITRDITIKSSTTGTVLTIADESLLENKIDITLALRNLTSLQIPLATDVHLASDLALLNKTSLKDTHLFVYLNIQNLRASSLSIIITAKVKRFVDEQSYDAERIISTIFNDDIGFIDASEGKTYDFDGNQFALRVNRNNNFSDTLFITSWPIAGDGKTTSTPQPVFNYVASDQFILRNNRREFWALINLKAGGGPLPYDVAAVMVILNTANRSTSNTFKVFLKDESIDGSMVRELNTIRGQLSGGGGLSLSLQESLGLATEKANLAKSTRIQKELEADNATAEKVRISNLLKLLQGEKAEIEGVIMVLTDETSFIDFFSMIFEKIYNSDFDGAIVLLENEISVNNDNFLLLEQQFTIIKADEEAAKINYQNLPETASADELTLALELWNTKSRDAANINLQVYDQQISISAMERTLTDLILNPQESKASAEENLRINNEVRDINTSEIDRENQDLLNKIDEIRVNQQNLTNAEAVERDAILAKNEAITLEAAANNDLLNIQKALA